MPNIDYPDRRLEAGSELRGCQLVQLRLLHIFDATCRELGLAYWIDSGTLLGAVRHGGFIPWDDDLDVCMLEEDYRRFLAEAPALLPAEVFLQHKANDPDYDIPFAKLRDRYSYLRSPIGREEACMNGIFLDIQPARLFTERERKWRRVLYALDGDFGRMGKARSLPPARRLRRAGLAALRGFLRLSGLGRLARWALGKGERPWIAYDVSYQRWWPTFQAVADVLPPGRIRFEDGEFPAPANVDAYLRVKFGDYMTPPPEHKRRPFHNGGILLTGPNPHPEGLPWPGAMRDTGEGRP